MKKLMVLMLSLVMVVCFTACGGNSGDTAEQASNEITELLDKGLVITQTSCDESTFKALIQTDGEIAELYLAEAAFTPDLYEEYYSLDMGAEDYADQQRAIIAKLTDVKVTDVTDQLPGDDDFDKYEDKKISDLEKEGYENTGNTETDDGDLVFFYDGPKYCLRVVVDEKFSKLDDLSANDISKLKIDDVEFLGLSSMFIDQ